MKILYAASSPIPSHSASSVHVMKMAHAISHLGHNVTVFAPEYNRIENDVSHQTDIFENYGIKKSFDFIQGQSIFRGKVGIASHMAECLIRLSLNKPDLVFARCLYAARMAAILNIPVIYERHDSFESGSRYEYLFKNLLKAKSFQRLVVISHALKEHLSKTYNILNDKIIVAADAADPVEVLPQNIKEGPLTFGYAGHLYPGKGVEVIVQLAQRHPNASFHIIGGWAEDIERWKKQTQNLKNLFWHGHKPHKEAMKEIQSFDVLLAPYQRKVNVSGGGGDISKWMSPLKLFEYMAAQKPIICSDLDVLREVMTNEVNCLLCAPDDIEAWVGAVERLEDDHSLRTALAKSAHDDFMKNYTWDARAQKTLSGIAT